MFKIKLRNKTHAKHWWQASNKALNNFCSQALVLFRFRFPSEFKNIFSGKCYINAKFISGIQNINASVVVIRLLIIINRSEEHTSELQSHVRISYAVFCLKKKKKKNKQTNTTHTHTYKHK